MIPDRAKQQHESCEPLLPVDDDPALNASRPDLRARGEHDGADEVRRRFARGERVRLLENVCPQLLQLGLLPAVRSLV